jgi:hypothetical protein
MESKPMKYLSGYMVALAVAFGALVLASMDVNARVVCGLNGCYNYYPHRSQWPVGGAHPTYYNSAAKYGYLKYRYSVPFAMACRRVTLSLKATRFYTL